MPNTPISVREQEEINAKVHQHARVLVKLDIIQEHVTSGASSGRLGEERIVKLIEEIRGLLTPL